MGKNKVVRIRYWQWIAFLFLVQFIGSFNVRISCSTVLIALLLWSERHNREYYTSIKRLVIQDELTGLFNYRFLRTRLEEEVARAKRYETPLLIMIIDLDKFKPFNDRYGHNAGNRALQKLALLLKQYTRAEDIVARFGGDEFVCLCPNITQEQGRVLAERLRRKIAEMVFVSEQGELTASIGLKSYIAGESPEEFFVHADEKLYRGKQNGRNQVYVA